MYPSEPETTARRVAAVLVTPRTGTAPPPGIPPERYSTALIEDTYEVLAGLELLTPALAVQGDTAATPAELTESAARLAKLTWPGTPITTVPGDTPHPERSVFAALTEWGTQQGVLVAGDAPDLPPLLIGKLFRGLAHADVAVCPAENGGLVALAANLPFTRWLPETGLDDPDALARLTAARPTRGALSVTPGWHRLRGPADVSHLDPGLEGWEATRALLESGDGR